MKILKKPEMHAAIGAVGGMLIGISQDNYGLGIALALALGTGVYVTRKKKGEKTEEVTEVTEETAEVSDDVSNT